MHIESGVAPHPMKVLIMNGWNDGPTARVIGPHGTATVVLFVFVATQRFGIVAHLHNAIATNQERTGCWIGIIHGDDIGIDQENVFMIAIGQHRMGHAKNGNSGSQMQKNTNA